MGQNLVRTVFQILSAVVLSRLLLPEQFGTFAVMMVLHGLVAPLIGGAFSKALIQKHDLSEEEASNFFWIAFAVAALFATAFAVAGPAIAAIFGNPIYSDLAIAFAALVWLDTVGAQYQAIVMRSMRFDVLFHIQLFTMPLALAAGVTAALAGLGTWALVIHMAVSSGMMRLLLMRALGWRPRRFSRVVGVRGMVNFGALMSLGSVTRLAYDRLPTLFLAKLAGPSAAGFFNRGDALFKRPLEQAIYPVAALLLPTMAASAKDRSRLQQLVVQGIWLLTLSMGPLIAVIAVFGDWIAAVLLGVQWVEAGNVMRWMAVMALGVPSRRTLASANAALGRPARSVGLKLVLLPPFLGLMFWAAPQGAAMAAMIMALFYVGMLPLEIAVLVRNLPLNLRAILRGSLASLMVITLVGGMMQGLRTVLPGMVDPTVPRLSDVADLFAVFLGAYVAAFMLAALFPEPRTFFRLIIGKLATRLPGRTRRASQTLQ